MDVLTRSPARAPALALWALAGIGFIAFAFAAAALYPATAPGLHGVPSM
jgi:hypothetical protein